MPKSSACIRNSSSVWLAERRLRLVRPALMPTPFNLESYSYSARMARRGPGMLDLLAPAPDGRGQVLIDGSHRAAVRIQTGLPVDAYMLTNTESALAIAITPLTTHAVHQAIQERGLLPDEH